MKKYIIISIIIAFVALYLYSKNNTVSYDNTASTTPMLTMPIKKDGISEAQSKINEALADLQKEEEKQNKLMEQENFRHQKEVDKIESELERIREVRLSFTSTPKQSQ